MSEMHAGIETLLSRYADCWTRLKPTELAGLWHPEETTPYYVAEEKPRPMWSMPELAAYWREAEGAFTRFAVRTWNLHCKPVAPELAAMQFMMHWNGVLKGIDPAPIGLDVKVFAMAQVTGDGATGDGWRFRHAYIESPLGALPYLKAAYRAGVDADFLIAR